MKDSMRWLSLSKPPLEAPEKIISLLVIFAFVKILRDALFGCHSETYASVRAVIVF